ncbi:hypothetical protein B0H11DRAFT_1707415, partial [Mycena galericulata]
FMFQYIVRRKHLAYWTKCNYVLSVAVDAGTAVGVIIVFFRFVTVSSFGHRLTMSLGLQYPLDGDIGSNSVPKWWSYTVFKPTLDWQSVPSRSLPAGESFGHVVASLRVCFLTILRPKS